MPYLFVTKREQKKIWNEILLNFDKNIEIMDDECNLFQHFEYIYCDIINQEKRFEIISKMFTNPISNIIISYLKFNLLQYTKNANIYHTP